MIHQRENGGCRAVDSARAVDYDPGVPAAPEGNPLPYEEKQTPEPAPKAGGSPRAEAAPQAAPRGAPSRRDVAAAGGYEAQRRLLSPTGGSDREALGREAGDAAPASAQGGPAPKGDTGGWTSVVSLEARVMAMPQFLGASVATLRRGAQVNVTSRQGSWAQVVTRQGEKGWLHENHIRVAGATRLRSGETGPGTVRGRDTSGPEPHEVTGRG
jgi:hypothetical protein